MSENTLYMGRMEPPLFSSIAYRVPSSTALTVSRRISAVSEGSDLLASIEKNRRALIADQFDSPSHRFVLHLFEFIVLDVSIMAVLALQVGLCLRVPLPYAASRLQQGVPLLRGRNILLCPNARVLWLFIRPGPQSRSPFTLPANDLICGMISEHGQRCRCGRCLGPSWAFLRLANRVKLHGSVDIIPWYRARRCKDPGLAAKVTQ
jgi:hypothetical protein